MAKRTRTKSRTSTTPTRRRTRYAWERLSDDELLDVRICDLDLRLEQTPLYPRVLKLYDELELCNIRLKPHVWLSSEWFSPDGVPGVAIPFYLAHERLMRLEDKMLFEVEGATERHFMRLMRHEAGHAISTGYRLHYRKSWREVFGRYSQPYPEDYQPKPNSTRYVLHLDWWYAQAHPAEDFAETFAVWLRPGSRWRQQYKGWPALHKLEFVDELMDDIAGTAPPVKSKMKVEPLHQLRMTLRQHYKAKRLMYGEEWPDFFDRDLQKLFSDDAKYAHRESAALFVRRLRPEVRVAVSQWTGAHQYTIDQVLRDLVDRCKELKLRVARPQNEAKTHLMLMVAVQTANYLHGGHYRVAL